MVLNLAFVALGLATFDVVSKVLVLWLPGRTIPSDLPQFAAEGFQTSQSYRWDPEKIPTRFGLRIVHSAVLQNALPNLCVAEGMVGYHSRWFAPGSNSISARPSYQMRYAISPANSGVVPLHPFDGDLSLKIQQILINGEVAARNQDDLELISKIAAELLPKGAGTELLAVSFGSKPDNKSLRLLWSRTYQQNIAYEMQINDAGTLKGASIEAELSPRRKRR